MNKPARIIFAGTPEFAVPPLQVLIDSPHEVVAVYTQPDRPAGRGRKLLASPVKQLAESAGVPVLQPDTLKDESARTELAALNADLMVVVAYGLLLPPDVLAMPARGCINLHASLLPRWRGASPIQSAVLHGDAESGVCIMQMDEGLDTGPVLAHVATPIGPEETAGELHDRLAVAGATLLKEQLEAILAGQLTPEAQPEEGATYAGRIKKADGLIDWTQPAEAIARQVRAYHPWPVAHTLYQGTNLRCLAATIDARVADESDNDNAPGAILAGTAEGLLVQTGAGVLAIKQLQLAGRKPVAAADFANAHAIADVVLGQ